MFQLMRLKKTLNFYIFLFTNAKLTGLMQWWWDKLLAVEDKSKAVIKMLNNLPTVIQTELNSKLARDFKKHIQLPSICRRLLHNLLMLINKKRLKHMSLVCWQFMKWTSNNIKMRWIIWLNQKSFMRRYLSIRIL